MTANLTYHYSKHCGLCSWIAKKENGNPENMLERVVAARELWCWVPHWRYDLGALMKCVCKVLIYHPPKSQHSIMIWCCCSRPWMLWGSAPCTTQCWCLYTVMAGCAEHAHQLNHYVKTHWWWVQFSNHRSDAQRADSVLQSVHTLFKHHSDVRKASVVANQSSQSGYVFTFLGSRPPQYSWPAAAMPNHDGMLRLGWMID